MVFEHGLTEACLYKDVLVSATHSFAGGTQEWRGRCHLPSKSACGPHEGLRHHKCATSLCLHRPQAAVVQRSSGQNNGAVSTYRHTLKMVKKKKDWNKVQDCLVLVTHSLYVLSGPAIAMKHPPPPFLPLSSAKNDWRYSCFLPDKPLSWKRSDALSSFPEVHILLRLCPIIVTLSFS